VGNRAVIERFTEALAANDFDAQDALLHDDYVGRYPQSGEVIRGRANRRAIMENYPGTEGGITASSDRILGTDDEFVTGPSWNIIHVSGSGDDLSLIGRITYPNGETWHTTLFLTMREGKIWREAAYFAPNFDPPAWRAAYVELEERGT
jgi:ketosteroid isomerase-like protein